MLAVNNRGIINRSLHSNYECGSFKHTQTDTHKLRNAHTPSHTKESNQSAKFPYLPRRKMELPKLAHLFWTIRVIEV